MNEPLAASPLVKALMAMVAADIPTCGIYWAGAPQDAHVPYAVFYPDSGIESLVDRTLSDGVPNDLRYQVTSVGETAKQAAWVADKTARSLLTGIPVVAGRRVRPTRQESTQIVRRDDVATALWIGTAQYLTRSERI